MMLQEPWAATSNWFLSTKHLTVLFIPGEISFAKNAQLILISNRHVLLLTRLFLAIKVFISYSVKQLCDWELKYTVGRVKWNVQFGRKSEVNFKLTQKAHFSK
jgi:hypothetical protein